MLSSISNGLKKMFGTKSEKDVKKLAPYVDAIKAEYSKLSSISDDEEICGCNGVTKGCVVNAIKEQDLKTLGEVKTCTKAGASCGSCLGIVEQILVDTLGDEYNDTVEGICDCCDVGHKDIKKCVDTNDFTNVYDVFKKLNWKTEDGCMKCRPAVNYYLLVKYNDDKYKKHCCH